MVELRPEASVDPPRAQPGPDAQCGEGFGVSPRCKSWLPYLQTAPWPGPFSPGRQPPQRETEGSRDPVLGRFPGRASAQTESLLPALSTVEKSLFGPEAMLRVCILGSSSLPSYPRLCVVAFSPLIPFLSPSVPFKTHMWPL